MRLRRLAVALVLSAGSLAWGQVPAATQPARSLPAIKADLDAVTKELAPIAANPGALLDPAKRAELAPKALPLFNRIEELMGELGNAAPLLKDQLTASRYQIWGMKAIFGDQQAEGQLREAAKGTGPEVINAKASLLLTEWIKSSKDAGVQSGIMDRAEQLAKEAPSDNTVAALLWTFTHFGPANDQIRDRGIKIINEDLKGPVAEQLKARLASMDASSQPTTAPAK